MCDLQLPPGQVQTDLIPVRGGSSQQRCTHLALSSAEANSTTLLDISKTTVKEALIPGFDCNSQTLAIAAGARTLVQITPQVCHRLFGL